ncbi:plastocyanin [Peptococcaceae bacterium CEB3]|nr:plastocyanin [Peptococcaceae bacterium CEB3]
MKKTVFLAPAVLLLSLGLTACGTTTAASSTPSSPSAGKTSTAVASSLKTDALYMTIKPGLKLGSDGKQHDSFSPTDLTFTQGVPTKVTVLNYDSGSHDIVSKDMNLNQQIPGSKKKGVPSVTTFTVAAAKTGDFHWACDVPCDGAAHPNKPGSNKGWAMSHDGYMAGTFHVVAQQPSVENVAMTVLPGTKLGSDGKLHDIFSPANLTIRKGETKVTVYNYDGGSHDFVSKDLNLNVQVPGHKKKGDPSVTTFIIKADKAGNYHWLCNVPCDGAANPNKPGSAKGWAMSHDGYMAGVVHVE